MLTVEFNRLNSAVQLVFFRAVLFFTVFPKYFNTALFIKYAQCCYFMLTFLDHS